MKLYRLLFTFLIAFLLFEVVFGINVIPTITITTQSKLDSLTSTRIRAHLIISGSNITYLDSLHNLTTVEGSLTILKTNVNNFNGLSHLDSVTGNFTIVANSALTDIDGLSGLNFIGGGLNIDSNYALLNVDGLSHLDSVAGNFTISNNIALANIDNLPNLTFIGGRLTIDSNAVMLSIGGFSRIDSIRGGLNIVANSALENIDGLSGLNFIRGGLNIDSNYALLNVDGLSKLDSVTGGLTIIANSKLVNIDGLSKLDSVAGGFKIVANSALADINGLSNLRFIGGGLNIDSNYAMLSINGLSKLDSVTGGLTIIANSKLVNIGGLSKLDSVAGGFKIVANSELADINGLSNLRFVGGGLNIDSDYALVNIDGLSKLFSVTGGLNILSNSVLANVEGLSNLMYIDGNLNIQNNTNLTEFCGLFNLLSSNGLKGAYNVAGNKINPSRADIISGGACSTQSSINAVVLGTNSVWFEAASKVHSGNIIVNDVSQGPTLNGGVELSIGIDVQTSADYFLMANRIKVKAAAQVNGDVYYNQLSNQGHINGSLNQPLSLPVYSVLPTFHQQAPGSQDITVPWNGSVTLTAGNYRDVVVRTNGTLFFSGGGTFSIRNLNAGSKVKLVFDQLSEVLISNRFDTDLNCYLGPADGSHIDASKIVFYVAGINGNNGDLNSLPKSAQIGLNNSVFANFYVPNGTLWLTGLTNATGAFIAKDVRVGLNVDIYKKSAFSGNSAAPKIVNNNTSETNALIAEVPKNYILYQNFPNPFNPTTIIKYATPKNEKVTIDIYDLLGRKVTELVNGEVTAGYHEIEFNAGNLASGIYFYKLSAGSYTQVNKMLLMK